MISLLLCLCMVFSLLPTAVLAADGEDPDTSAGPGAVPELGNPATEGTSGGIDWKVENGTLTITPSSNPESDDYTEGEMVGDYGTLTKKDPDDADYIAALRLPDIRRVIKDTSIIRIPRHGCPIPRGNS